METILWLLYARGCYFSFVFGNVFDIKRLFTILFNGGVIILQFGTRPICNGLSLSQQTEQIRVIIVPIIIQLMRNNIAFRLTAQNSLKMNEITHKQQKNLLNTFKAGSDLRSQLHKVKPAPKTIRVGEGTDSFLKQQQKAQEQVLAQEVAALDHFKAPVTRDKTKNLIQNIKLRRRQKHIDALSRFKQDVDEYKETLTSAYESLVNDIEQVMSIKSGSLNEYLNSCDNKEYLLSREKQIIGEIQEHVMGYKMECQAKLNFAKEELLRIQNDRAQMAGQICQSLCLALIEIAFILEPQAREIEKKQREEIKVTQANYFTTYSDKISSIIAEQQKRNEAIQARSNEVITKWRTQKQQHELTSYMEDAESDKYRRNHALRLIFDALIAAQEENHGRKMKLLDNLILEDTDSLSKVNIDKFNEAVRKINENFDHVLDRILSQLKTGNADNKNQNESRLQKTRNYLQYIEKHNSEEVQQIIQQKCQPLCKRNIEEQQELSKKAINYAESQDEKQNKIIELISKFVMRIGTQNDNFIKEFGTLNQKYEIEKAKILDEDQETVDKLKEELDVFKKELKEALHHIKLEEVEKKCFEKVDEIEKAYRQCHEKNKALKETRTPSLATFMQNYQAKLAQNLELFNPSRRAQLEEKNKKECEEEAQRRIEAEEKKKAEEQLKAAEEAKAKGGKAPPPAKPKDPKKAAAELEERKKTILAEIGTKKIQEIKSQTGSIWLVYKSVPQICQAFYKQATKQLSQGKPEIIAEEGKPEEQKKKALDQFEQAVKDCRSNAVVNQKSFIKLKEVIPMLEKLRTKIFDGVSAKKSRIIEESEKIDEEMLEESLINLDNRLKAHYSLKGTIESEIFVKRSGQITSHKKKYEKYARTIKEKIDLQTQKFNFLLQKGLQSLKNHMTEQKMMKEHIAKSKNLSQLQGLYSRTKQNFNSFGLTIKQIYNELQRFSSSQIETLLKKNEQFIKQSKLMKDGGDYSPQEIAWYEQMMNEITTQMKEQQQKREQKLKELKEHSQKRKQELLEAFEKEYNVAVQELAARDGTGKKYGRPKRIAQQKTRLQMNKCEQSQININKMISDMAKEYQIQVKNNFQLMNAPELQNWRKRLMTIQYCIMRYSKHIEALKPDLKINQMIRVNYNMRNPEAKLTPEEQEEDKKRREEEIKALGRLSEQKDERTFMKYVEDIEKVISDESRTIYVGDKAKFLTGTDKIPDFLRVYIVNMKKSCEAFRVSCVRQLRESCQKYSDLSSSLSQLVFSSLLSFYSNNQKQNRKKVISKFTEFAESHKKIRADNLKKLRPNLSNPKCQDQLKQLDKSQKQRNEKYNSTLDAISTEFKDSLFKNAQEFLSCLLNNYQFLLLLTDSFYLHEDFMKLPGDQIQQKNHLETQKLMVMKQKGIKIDPSSERNLRKKWDGVDYSVFNIDNRKYEYKKAEEVPKDKDKKAGKKDTKDPKKQEEVPQDSDPSKSKVLETFKTWRQKSVFQARERARQTFKSQFDKILTQLLTKIEQDKKQNNVFCKKWRQIADSLYIK